MQLIQFILIGKLLNILVSSIYEKAPNPIRFFHRGTNGGYAKRLLVIIQRSAKFVIPSTTNQKQFSVS